MKKVLVDEELLQQILEAACSPYCAQDLGKLLPALRAVLDAPAVESDNLQCKSVQKRLAAQCGYTQPTPSQESATKAMTAHRAVYFMERFKKEEKLLGPNEQAAVDFVITMLTTHAQQPEQFVWGVDWGSHGERTCVSIIKKHQNGTIEVVATEYEPR